MNLTPDESARIQQRCLEREILSAECPAGATRFIDLHDMYTLPRDFLIPKARSLIHGVTTAADGHHEIPRAAMQPALPPSMNLRPLARSIRRRKIFHRYDRLLLLKSQSAWPATADV